MRKSFLVIKIACVSILAASFAQQSQASQPTPQPAQTPAVAPAAPASTCPNSPTPPTVTGPLNEGAVLIAGTANKYGDGCISYVEVHATAAGGGDTVLPMTDDSDPGIHRNDGKYSVKLKTALTNGQNVTVKQIFLNTNTAAAAPVAGSVSSASLIVQAVPTPTPTPTPAPTPQIAGTLREGANAISGTIGKLPATVAGAASGTTCSAQMEVHDISGTGQLLQMSGGAARGAVGTDNTYSLTLQEPFRGGQKIRVDEVFQNCAGPATLSSDEVDVVVPGDWGRVRGYFTSGILLSQNQNSFSQSSLFMGFNLDKTWRMPGYYHPRTVPWKSATEALQKQAHEKQAAAAEKASIVIGCDQGPSKNCQTLQHDREVLAKAETSRRTACETKQKGEKKQQREANCQRAADQVRELARQVGEFEAQAYHANCQSAGLTAGQKKACDDAKLAFDDAEKASQAAKKGKTKNPMSWMPGINTFFDVRLTSIPVSACNLPNGAAGSNSGSCASPSPTPTPAAGTVHQQAADATPSPTPLDTFLSQRKTARLTVGTYFPFTITSWTYNKTPNALFIAPLAKVGFDTPAGDLTQVQSSSTNTTTGTTTNTSATTVTAVNQTSFYNFYGYGGRIGHYALTSSRNEAPELVSYLDVIVGRFSNLESLIIPETGATLDHPAKRIRLYRLALEGVLKVPSTPMIIGFSANVGQESLGLGPNTIVQRAGDDLRFLFGVRFDAAKLMSVIAKAAP
jgi:hypothetical protein